MKWWHLWLYLPTHVTTDAAYLRYWRQAGLLTTVMMGIVLLIAALVQPEGAMHFLKSFIVLSILNTLGWEGMRWWLKKHPEKIRKMRRDGFDEFAMERTRTAYQRMGMFALTWMGIAMPAVLFIDNIDFIRNIFKIGTLLTLLAGMTVYLKRL